MFCQKNKRNTANSYENCCKTKKLLSSQKALVFTLRHYGKSLLVIFDIFCPFISFIFRLVKELLAGPHHPVGYSIQISPTKQVKCRNKTNALITNQP